MADIPTLRNQLKGHKGHLTRAIKAVQRQTAFIGTLNIRPTRALAHSPKAPRAGCWLRPYNAEKREGRSQVIQLETYTHQTQLANFSSTNLAEWDFSMTPLRHTIAAQKMDTQEQNTRWWLWILTILVIGALILIGSILSGIGYCSFNNRQSS